MKGYIVLVESKNNSFISRAIKFFTGRLAKKYGVKSYTHAMYTIGKVLDVESVFSAELAMSVMPLQSFRTKDYDFDVYRINDAILVKDLDNILRGIYTKTAGTSYGFLQLLWFIYRWMAEMLGFDVRKQRNWFPNGDVCSENAYRYLIERLQRNGIGVGAKRYRDIRLAINKLREWNENTFTPVDLAMVIKSYPNLFELVESWSEKKGLTKKRIKGKNIF